MLHWFGPVFPLDIIYTFINYLTAFFIVCFLGLRLNIDKKFLILLIITLLFPFFINGPLMDWTALPDQSKYLKDTLYARNLDFNSLDHRPSIYIPATIFALSPIPFIYSFNDVGIINRLIFSVLIIFLIKKKLPDFLIFYLILSPTILLYSSSALKETIILSLTILGFYALIKKKYIVFLIPLFLLILCKTQNGLIIFIMYLVYIYIFSINFKTKNLLSLLIILIIPLIVLKYDELILQYINFYRYNFFQENSGINYVGFSTIDEIIINIPYNFMTFLISPFPELNSIIKIVIFGENIIVISLLIYYFLRLYSYSIKQFYFWLIYFSFFLSMYSLTLFNHGTISRYKVSFVIPILIIMSFLKKTSKLN